MVMGLKPYLAISTNFHFVHVRRNRMIDIYEKICVVIGQILCFSKKISWASAPIFDAENESVVFMFRDKNGNALDISIPYSSLSKAHDHTLETMVFDIMRQQDLL